MPVRETRAPADSAQRTETRSGVTERALFLGHWPKRIFCVHHLPEVPRATVVLCSSVNVEFFANYRREVDLARALARAGMAVIRFHYRGAGHSDGDELTFEGMLEDADTVWDHFTGTEAGSLRAAFGTSFGSLVAGSLASASASLLAMWQPVTDPCEYLNQIARNARILDLSDGADVRGEGGEPRATPERMDILGYTYDRALFASPERRRAASELGLGSHGVYILELTRKARVSRRYEALTARLKGQGCPVEVAAIDGYPHLWFVGRPQARPDIDPVTPTVDWLTSQAALASEPR